MPDRLPPGPYRNVKLDDGTEAPFYVIPFDKKGRCEGPETRQHLIEAVQNGTFTDVFLFSHGWNNDWKTSIARYEDFLKGYMDLRRRHSLPVPAPYRPLMVGIFWPSTALVFGEKEKGPSIAAAGDPAAMDEAVAEERAEVREIAEQLPDADVERFYELVQKESLTKEEALDLAGIAQRLMAAGGGDETPSEAPPSAEEILRVWKAAAPEPEPVSDEDFGTTGGGGAAGPQAAAGLGFLDPRPAVRMFTVWQMKDRAGTVGAKGVGPLLRDLLAKGQARVHLIGHSYGGKVVLSAISFGGDLPRKVRSILLLQPAVSHLSFAEKVPGTDRPGGYRVALDRVESPVLSTFSDHDVPLTKVFHLAVRRDDDLGEAKIAAAGEPPSKYAALGGFGPRKAGEKLIEIRKHPNRYELDGGTRIYGLDGSKDKVIAGHGEISNEATWWALYNLVTA
jgi:hypothetical protein